MNNNAMYNKKSPKVLSQRFLVEALLLLWLLNLHQCRICWGFVVGPKTAPLRYSSLYSSSSSVSVSDPGQKLPTIEQLSNDPFMKQVQYGMELTQILQDDPSSEHLFGSIKAQLSHSDGIRGFMVSYLTSSSSSSSSSDTAESEETRTNVPTALLRALLEQVNTDPTELIPLMCMNIVMPTAMTTMHQDPEQSANSSMTAKRAIQLVEALLINDEKEDDDDEILKEESRQLLHDNINAILVVAEQYADVHPSSTTIESSNESSTLLVKYWTDFFDKWGYKKIQAIDIANSVRTVARNIYM